MAEIILTFNTDGTIKKETKGFIGKTCVSDTKFIEEALGETSDRQYKSEYYDEQVEEQVRVRNRN
jgi:hypothetical protein